MANFKTHLAVATGASGLASVTLLNLNLATPWETGSYFLLGVLGGLLPDIDSDRSTPLLMIFYGLSMYCAFAMVFNIALQYSLVELFAIWVAIYFGIRYLIFEMVIRVTVHRGVFHSLLAVAFMLLLTADCFYYVLHKSARYSWNAGVFLALGYLVHLSLDELFSVDLHNKRMKKSFGTALKLFSRQNKGASLLMAASLLLFMHYAPPAKSYWQTLQHTMQHADWQAKLLPQQQWFKGLLN